ncbi:MAG: TerB family tellurite resistance protein [Clostridiales bacterium]|nr:TerB family tellurite resistance protein [Clostridiales bacterium]
MIYDENKLTQLKLFYLFMNVDGKCTDEEKKKFDSICRSFRANKEEKQSVIDLCDKLELKENADNSEIVIKVMDSMLKNTSTAFMEKIIENLGSYNSLNHDKNAQVHTIWTMINLGYADAEYSEPEKKVVQFLTEKWKMDKNMVSSMIDTTDTILALTNQKEWLMSTDKTEEQKNVLLDEIEGDIKRMFKNMERCIDEAAI